MSRLENNARDLARRLAKEEHAHAETRRLLQLEIARVWRLVPAHYISLMGVYPALRKLLPILTEAADLQDPMSGVPTEDTSRVEFVHVGEHASTSQTERGVITHQKQRQTVARINTDLDNLAHAYAQWLNATELEYNPPTGVCLECGEMLTQRNGGRPRLYCSDLCRQRSSRNVTKLPPPKSATGD